jgi:hypothetical protein
MAVGDVSAGPAITTNVVLTGCRLGIGASPGSYPLYVYGDVVDSAIAKFVNDGNNVNRYGIAVQCGEDTPTTNPSAYHFLAEEGDGASTGQLRTNNTGVFALADV